MNRVRPLRIAALAVLASCLSLPAPPSSAQAGSGSRYKVTMSMEMPGMPFQMPGQTTETCGPKAAAGEAMVPKQSDDCEIRNYRVSGNKSSFDMVCRGEGAMSGSGEFETLGPDRYRGQIKVSMEGQPMLMKFEGQRTGDCDYAKESPMAQVQKQIGQSCDQLLGESGAGLLGAGANFLGKDAMCTSKKAAYCGKIAPLADDPATIRERMQMEAQMRAQGAQPIGGFWETLQGCGQSRATVLPKACGKAERSGDFGFVGEFCPDQTARLCPTADPAKHAGFLFDHCAARAQALVAQHCAGRDFTALRSSPYAAFCSRAAAARLQRKPGS